MARKAYFMINIAEQFCQNGYTDVLRDLEAIPDIRSIERVSGACNLLVQVESPSSRMISVAHKIMTEKWFKNLHVLYIEPINLEELEGLNVDDLIWLKKVNPTLQLDN